MISGLFMHCKNRGLQKGQQKKKKKKSQEDNVIISPLLIYLSVSNSQLGNLQFRLTPGTINLLQQWSSLVKQLSSKLAMALCSGDGSIPKIGNRPV
jgi:hypothetical protein